MWQILALGLHFSRKNVICAELSIFGSYIVVSRRKDEQRDGKVGVYWMSRVCYFTGKRTVAGRSIARRGKAKRLGGVGRKVTGITKRKFKPNIQKVRAVIDGKVCRIKVSAKAIRMGLIQKPAKRDYKPAEKVSD